MSNSFLRALRRNRDPGTKGPLGLTTVYTPPSDQPVIADVVFVHGLNGGSRSTWTQGGDPALFWPGKWLPGEEAFRDVGIHTFGYPSDVGRKSVLGVRDFARSLLAAVADSPAINRPGVQPPPRLVFVAHSMGGLVVKAAYILSHRDPTLASLTTRISGILFLGTPHQGAAIARTLSNLLSLSGPRPFVDDIVPGSAALQGICEEFPEVCGGLQLRSFFETRPVEVGGRRIMIVEKDGAVLNLPNERRAFLDVGHRELAMFGKKGDAAYVAVRDALAAVVSCGREPPGYNRVDRTAPRDDQGLERFLGISGAPEEGLEKHEVTPGSCEWIKGKPYFKAWVDSSTPRTLWLRGRPGAGKSVLAAQIVRELRGSGVNCCYFFFRGDETDKNTVGAFLRSMVRQMAVLHPTVADKIRRVMACGKDDVDGVDADSLWKTLWGTGVLEANIGRHQFWVIDGIDECERGAELMTFLARIQETWPVSALITSTGPVDAYRNNASRGIDIQSQVISEEDTKRDIVLLLDSDVGLHRAPAVTVWESRDELVAHIAENAKGSFLWASLVCSVLHKATTKGEVEKTLVSVPAEMDTMYSKILSDMSKATFGKELAKAFLAWTMYAFRPLSVDDIRAAVETDIEDEIGDVGISIAKSCGKLVHVEADKVQLVHPTARMFLTRGNLVSEFVVPQADGHRRLATVCLRFLLKAAKGMLRKPRAESTNAGSTPRSTTPSSFIYYASAYLFQHLDHMLHPDKELLALVSEFLKSPALLNWIGLIATDGDLSTIYNAGQTLASLHHRVQDTASLGLASGSQNATLEQWGDDLTHLTTRFSRQLKTSPRSIYHLIPPFCPLDSPLRRHHSAPARGLAVQGLSARGWDECLTVATYPSHVNPGVVAAGPGIFAVGMREKSGYIFIYDDVTFQEIRILENTEPVWRMAFSKSGKYLASAGGRSVRIWNPDGMEVGNFKIAFMCMALSFEPDDTVLRVVTKKNKLLEWDIQAKSFRCEALTWHFDLEENQQYRDLTLAALDIEGGILAVIYKGHDILLWEYAEDRIYDVYEKETGSVDACGSYKIADGSTTVRALAFCRGKKGVYLGATYLDGDLVSYNVESGKVAGVLRGANTLMLASSRDGRTLAGADSRANITLFEPATLGAFYRVRFETALLPTLAFIHDCRRLVEVRGEQCRVWEPPALLRGDRETLKGADKDCVAGSVAAPGLKITAMACCKGTSTVFVATEDGVVQAYDTAAEPVSQVLFTLSRWPSIALFSFDEASSTLKYARGNTVAVHRLIRRRVSRLRHEWVTPGSPLLEVRTPDCESAEQVLASGEQSRLLIATRKATTLWAVPGEGEKPPEAPCSKSGCGGAQWLMHTTKADQLLYVDGSKVATFSWKSLEPINVIRLSLEGSPQVVPLLGSQYFATISRPEDEGPAIQLWDVEDLKESSTTVKTTKNMEDLSSTVAFLIGVSGSRLVFYTTDTWVASVDLSNPTRSTFVRHFFIPSDWIGSMRSPIFGIGRSGEVLFVKGPELAVIRRGLEITEGGGRFHPDGRVVKHFWRAHCDCVQTSTTPIFAFSYGFNYLHVGFCFLAGGAGVITGVFVTGKLLNVNFRHVAAAAGFSVDRVRGDDVSRFPFKKARSRGSVRIIFVSMCVVVGYEWVVERRVHPAVPLVMQGCLGCKCTVLLQVYSALIVDIFPEATGTAAAANNITRCTLAAVGVAVLDPLVNTMGYGWVFTLLGLLDGVSCVLPVLALRQWGRRWRDERVGRRLARPEA